MKRIRLGVEKTVGKAERARYAKWGLSLFFRGTVPILHERSLESSLFCMYNKICIFKNIFKKVAIKLDPANHLNLKESTIKIDKWD